MQLTAWDGGQGAFWTDRADRFDAGAARYLPHLLDAGRLDPTSRALDVGCGSGTLAREAARHTTAGTVLGVDLSSRQLELTRRRTVGAGLDNVSFLQADAQVHPFTEAGVDVVLSRHGSMFFGDPAEAFANLTRALRPGGRMALVTWQPLADNEWIRTFRTILGAGRDLPAPSPTAPGAFSMSEPARDSIPWRSIVPAASSGWTWPMMACSTGRQPGWSKPSVPESTEAGKRAAGDHR